MLVVMAHKGDGKFNEKKAKRLRLRMTCWEFSIRNAKKSFMNELH